MKFKVAQGKSMVVCSRVPKHQVETRRGCPNLQKMGENITRGEIPSQHESMCHTHFYFERLAENGSH